MKKFPFLGEKYNGKRFLINKTQCIGAIKEGDIITAKFKPGGVDIITVNGLPYDYRANNWGYTRANLDHLSWELLDDKIDEPIIFI